MFAFLKEKINTSFIDVTRSLVGLGTVAPQDLFLGKVNNSLISIPRGGGEIFGADIALHNSNKYKKFASHFRERLQPLNPPGSLLS